MSANPNEQDAAALAALYVGGAMDEAERRAFESQLAHDEALQQELHALTDVAKGLAGAVTPVTPDEATREKIMNIADDLHVAREHRARQVWRGWEGDAAPSTLFTLRADEGDWEDTGVDGITVRRLYVDRENNRMTAMFRMQPGTSYVPHVHDGPEECFVLEGDLHVGDEIVMHAGDYQLAPAGSLHGVQRTEGGCLLLVSCSLSDEVVD